MGHRSAAPPPGRVGNPPLQALHAGQVLPARDARPPRILHAEDFGYLYLPPTDVAERLRRYDFKDHAVETKAKIVWPYKSIDIRIDRQSWSESYDLDLDPEERVNRARRAQGPTRKPEKDEGALEAKLREWRKAREGPPRFGASPIWNRFVRQVRGERRLPDSEPDRPMPSWLPPHLAARGAYVPMSFIVAVDDPVELRRHVLSSRAFQENGHQWLFVDNRQNRAYSSISKLYAEARRRAEGEFLCFMHQDVLLPPDWDERVTRHLFNELNSHDPNWGVVGVAGRAPRSPAVTDPPNIGHWSDPHRYHEPTVPLPAEVQILDELLMIVRADSGLAFDPDLPGFHCYGADLCLTAREKGMKNYVIDAPVVHKLFRPDGTLIETGDRTHKIANRQTDAFRADFMRSADYVRTKWAKYLPFEGTSYRWT